MITQIVESFTHRKNPLLENFPVDKNDIRENFKSITTKYSFEVFLQEHSFDSYEIKDEYFRINIIERYKARLSVELLGLFGKILRHYVEITERISCTSEEIVAYYAMMDNLQQFEAALLDDHIAHLYPQKKQTHDSPNIIKKTAGKIRKGLTRK